MYNEHTTDGDQPIEICYEFFNENENEDGHYLKK